MGKYSIYPDDAALERIADGRKVTYVQQNSHFYIAALESVGGLRVGFAWRVPCPDGNKKPYWELCVWSDAASQVVAAGTPCVGFSGCADPIKWSKSSEAKFAQIRDALLDFAVWRSEDAIKAAWSKMYDLVQIQLAKHFAPTRMWRVIYETRGSYDLPVYMSTWRKSELAARKFAAKKGTYIIGEYSPAPPPWERDTQDCEPMDIAMDLRSSKVPCRSARGVHEGSAFEVGQSGVTWQDRRFLNDSIMLHLREDLWVATPDLPFVPHTSTHTHAVAVARGLVRAGQMCEPTVKGMLVLARDELGSAQARKRSAMAANEVRYAWAQLTEPPEVESHFDRFWSIVERFTLAHRLRAARVLPVDEEGNTLTTSLENWGVFGEHAVLQRRGRMWEIYRRVPAGPKWAGLHAWRPLDYYSNAATAREVVEQLEADRLAE